MKRTYAHCLKNNQNVAFEFWHFPPIFVLSKLTCLATLFDRKLQVFSPKCKRSSLRSQCFPSSIFGWFSSCGGDTYNSMQFILHCQEFCKSLGRLRKKCYYFTEAFAASIERQKFFGKIHDSLARLYFIGLRGHTREAVFHVPYFFYFRPLATPRDALLDW